MIVEPYTLFGRIPLYRDRQGKYAADPLWQKDLALHLRYIADFRICCPVEQVAEHDRTTSCVAGLSDRNVIALRRDRGWGSIIRNFFPNAFRVRKALGQTQIAHSGGAGWAFPVSYYILGMRPFLRFKWVIVIESSFFRLPVDGKATLRQVLSHHIHSFLVRRCVRAADARIFTSRAYQELFLGEDRAVLVAPAIWIDQTDIAPRSEHESRKPDGRRRARFLFPARLIPDKGVQTVLDAISLLAKRQATGEIALPRVDIIGQGPLAEKCRQFAAGQPDDLVRFHDPVPYGPRFFDLLRTYDAVIVANLQDEQPRIIYDAFSQGLPCLSSRTGGTQDLITPGETGLFFEAGNAESLAERLTELAGSADRLHRMGGVALAQMAEATHENMHRQRESFLEETLSLSNRSPGWRSEDNCAPVSVSS